MSLSQRIAAVVVAGSFCAVFFKTRSSKSPRAEQPPQPDIVVDGVPVSQKTIETYRTTEKQIDRGPVLVIEERGKVLLDGTTIIVGSADKKALVHGVLAAVYPKLMGEPVNGRIDLSIGFSHPRIHTVDEYAAMLGEDPPAMTVEQLLKLPKSMQARVPGFTWIDNVPVPHPTLQEAKERTAKDLGAHFALVYRAVDESGEAEHEGAPMRPESTAKARPPFDIGPVRVNEARASGAVDSCSLYVASARDQELARGLLHAAFPRLIDPAGKGKYLRGVFRLDELVGDRSAMQGQLRGHFAVVERTLGDRRP